MSAPARRRGLHQCRSTPSSCAGQPPAQRSGRTTSSFFPNCATCSPWRGLIGRQPTTRPTPMSSRSRRRCPTARPGASTSTSAAVSCWRPNRAATGCRPHRRTPTVREGPPTSAAAGLPPAAPPPAAPPPAAPPPGTRRWSAPANRRCAGRRRRRAALAGVHAGAGARRARPLAAGRRAAHPGRGRRALRQSRQGARGGAIGNAGVVGSGGGRGGMARCDDVCYHGRTNALAHESLDEHFARRRRPKCRPPMSSLGRWSMATPLPWTNCFPCRRSEYAWWRRRFPLCCSFCQLRMQSVRLLMVVGDYLGRAFTL
jgi:hypothetical protein